MDCNGSVGFKLTTANPRCKFKLTFEIGEFDRARFQESLCALLHLPDYDPVGLSEFQRLHTRLGERVSLHLPADLEARFAQFSSHKLLGKRNSKAMLAQLRRLDLLPVRHVVELIERYNAGLEQEALLVKFYS